MSKLNKYLALGLSALMLAACSNNSSSTTTESSDSSSDQATEETAKEETAAEENEEAEKTTEESSNDQADAVVVYFSATGNTQKVAEYIAEYEDCPTFQVEPVEEYTEEDLSGEDGSRVATEFADLDNVEVELKDVEVPDWDDYSLVFIGYPIWNGVAAWPIDTFCKANDFQGKTVYPFCTSGSSDIGETAGELESLAESGEWMEGHRFASDATQDEVDEWLESLSL